MTANARWLMRPRTVSQGNTVHNGCTLLSPNGRVESLGRGSIPEVNWPYEGLSRMKGNFQVRFLEGGGLVTARFHSAGKREARFIRNWARKLLRESRVNVRAQASAEIAPLLLLRFGDGRSARLLKTCLERDLERKPTSVVRACAVVYLSYGGGYFDHVRRIAARVLRNPLGELVKMVEKIRDYDEMPLRFIPRLDVRFDAVAGKHYLDMRAILQGRLLALNPKPRVGQWLRDKKRSLLKAKLSAYDKRLIRRLL